jgi:hypothetical protein
MRAYVLVAVSTLALLQAPQFTIPPGKHLPYAIIAPAADPLAACDADGVTTGNAPSAQKKRENAAKNNLWVTGTPTALEFADFTTLQNAIGDKPDLTASRKIVETPRTVEHGKAGEGSLVQLVAHIRDVHIADCLAPAPPRNGEFGEAVNCDFIGVHANDLHITLMPPSTPTANECDSVTAEMIPHFRPDAWQMLDQRTPTNNSVRLTGTLFFDDSHKPCNPQTKKPASNSDPPRRSVWEIHPIYALDVCTAPSTAQCTATNAAVWMPYDKWVATHANQTTVTDLGGARASCNALAHNQPVVAPRANTGRSR